MQIGLRSPARRWRTRRPVTGVRRHSPTFQALWNKHPGHISVLEAYKKVGREDAVAWGAANACTVRMCIAFHEAGFTIQPPKRWLRIFGTGAYARVPIIIRVTEFDTAMRQTYGAPTLSYHGNDGHLARAMVAKKKGVIEFVVSGFSNASGHFDLWNGSACKSEDYFQPSGPSAVLEAVYFWQFRN